MRLATLRTPGGNRAVRVEGDRLVDVGFRDVGALLADGDWQDIARTAVGAECDAQGADFAPLVPQPSKIVCVGLNYRTHIQEMGRDLPEYPTLFAKFADCLVGATDPIVRPDETDAFDWEVELAVVIGKPVRRASETTAEEAIAGFTVLNDVTCRAREEWLPAANVAQRSPPAQESLASSSADLSMSRISTSVTDASRATARLYTSSSVRLTLTQMTQT